MKKIKKLTQTCEACPSQWEGEFEDGSPVYIRYRWGYLSVEGVPRGKELFGEQVGSSLRGVMTTEEMLEHTGLELSDSASGRWASQAENQMICDGCGVAFGLEDYRYKLRLVGYDGPGCTFCRRCHRKMLAAVGILPVWPAEPNETVTTGREERQRDA